ncbi:Serine/threonine-protein kinase PknA [Enhygromyxa salina]|uniref:Serine/threonine-protein kinase PknA n=1 Tax=Enhygromyxa salina TaxID=215803 RepID=A0A2S9XF89_9BACT|nr:protein kinase [Enhygromyxa salina]PRP91341.1 Serine/threonine-protein kinase PknA [Enhygromyxa salina]
MAQLDRSSGHEHAEPTGDPDAPVRQSRIETEAAPRASGDPMASIRPELPANPRLVAATVELTDVGAGAGVGAEASERDGLDDATLEPPPRWREPFNANETHESGPFVIPVLEPREEGDREDENGQARPADAAYELLARIGAGGMGEVWEARQRSLGRSVALKRLRDGRRTAHAVIRQFESEARLTGVLDHPNIVTVHELGRDQGGRVFYTMKRIEGTAWSQILATGQRSTGVGEIVIVELRDHLDILVEVSHAIAFAHSRGVIHRDIKPGNVMIGDYGEVQVVDWGLAVALRPLPGLGGAETWTLASLPRSALVCGTPAYMSPETAMAARERIGPPTDVYLLGAVLYHVLYGRPPHQGKSVHHVLSTAKVNGWSYPRKISGHLKPWDALLRPVINRALASDPGLRFADAGEFGEALRRAIRNYDSAKVASRAQEELAARDESHTSGAAGYQALVAMIARLEGALESWPRNVAARQTLAQAHLELATLALAIDDHGLARISIDAFDKLPPLPAPEPDRVARRLTTHSPGEVGAGAGPPTASLVAGSSSEWAGSDLVTEDVPTSTLGAIELARARAQVSGELSPRSELESASVASVASVRIQQDTSETTIGELRELDIRAEQLRTALDQREHALRRRRLTLWFAAGLAAVLAVATLVAMGVGRMALGQERDRARQERDALSKVLLDATANTVEAQLEILFRPVHGALMTSVSWTEAGTLDVDNPELLNPYFIPLLEGVDAASSMLRADADGYEYMLLSNSTDWAKGWRTRSTIPGAAQELRDWSSDGELLDLRRERLAYDPHQRPWYIGGAKLRERAPRVGHDRGHPVFWTEPYIFFTTGELGISVSAPATSSSGREFVLAFDVRLGDLSRVTSRLPEGVEQGQVFVLDDQLRLLGLPRETLALSADQRKALLLEPMAEVEAAPICRAAFTEWRERGDEPGGFSLAHNGENYWVGFRRVEAPDRPKLWIGVVVPESYFL